MLKLGERVLACELLRLQPAVPLLAVALLGGLHVLVDLAQGWPAIEIPCERFAFHQFH